MHTYIHIRLNPARLTPNLSLLRRRELAATDECAEKVTTFHVGRSGLARSVNPIYLGLILTQSVQREKSGLTWLAATDECAEKDLGRSGAAVGVRFGLTLSLLRRRGLAAADERAERDLGRLKG